MNSKILNGLLILTSLVGFLQWGNNQHMFLFEIEIDILSKLFSDPLSVLHPVVILPMLAQAILIFTLFQNVVSKTLTYLSMIGLALLLVFMLFVGVLSLNFKIIVSTLPFIIIATISLRHYKNLNKKM